MSASITVAGVVPFLKSLTLSRDQWERVQTRDFRSDKSSVAEFRSGQYLTVRVARHDFAVLAAHVRGVLPMHELVSDDAAGSVAGTVSISGEPVTVFDLRVKLNLRSGSYGRNPSVVVVQTAEGLAGFVADSVSEVIYARAHDFRAGKIRIGRARPIVDPELLTLSTIAS